MRTDLSRDNSLVADVRRGRRITPIWLAIPLGAGLVVVVTAVLAPLAIPPLVSLVKAVSEPLYAAYFSSIITILAFAFIALVLLLWVRLAEGRPFNTIGFHARSALLGIPLGLGLALLFTTAIMGALDMLGMVAPKPPGTDPIGMAAMQGIVMAAIMFAVQASTEEMVYRGWMQNVLAVKLGPPIAIAIVTIAFTWAHSRNAGFGVLPGFNLVLFAVFLSLLALRTGSLWAGCAWHAGWNWSLSNLWGVPLSGIEPEGGSATAWTLTGPAVMTGGTWGPEGGLLATAVLAGATVWVALWRGLGDRPAPTGAPLSAEARLAAYRATHRH
ncbi:MAG TPA: type II CAAX endopeptidase family protein [Vineibacter sp.]|nr:type II CAAX endopeptidase family protein [Vineibacter sp.]